jgi:death on curing protein
MHYLTKKLIVQFNVETIDAHGGNFNHPNNFLHEENLDYLIEAIHSELFGQQMYPTITDKAAVYCYNIICNHIFSDGNKRTGLLASLNFLNINGFDISEQVNNTVMTDFILAVASGEVSLDECRKWFADNTVAL